MMPTVKLGDVAMEVKEAYKGDKAGYPIVGLEHITPEEVTLSNWSVDTENTFTKMFRKDDILFGRRRAYLKKAAIAPFDGICSGDITVIRAKSEKLFPMLLPFIIQNDDFFEYAVGKSAGSLSPRVKWEHLKNYEFKLPSLEKQKELADLLWAINDSRKAYQDLLHETDELIKSHFIEMFGDGEKYPSKQISDIADVIAGGDKPKDISEEMTDEYCYPVYANGIENEGLQCYSKEYRVDKDAVTISARGTIGATFVRKPYFTPVVRLIAVIPKTELNTVFLKYAIDYAEIISNGSSQQQLTIPNVKTIEVVIPPIEEQNEYADLVVQSDKSKFELKQAIEEVDNLIRSLVQQELK